MNAVGELHAFHRTRPPTDEDPPIARLHFDGAEQAVLGAAMLEPEAAGYVCTRCRAEHFYRAAHKVIFEAVVGVFNDRRPVDIITVGAALRYQDDLDTCGGPQYLTELLARVPTTAHVNAYIGLLHGFFEKRLPYALQHGVSPGGEGSVEAVQEKLDQIRSQRTWGDEPKPLSQFDVQGAVDGFLRQREQFDHATPHFDLPTVDDGTGGLPCPGYVLLMADAGIGKTSLALQATHHGASAHGHPALYYSLEMTVEAQIVPRLAVMHVGQGTATRDELHRAATNLLALPITFRERSVTVEQLRADVLRESRGQNPPKLVVVDYVQLLDTARSMEELPRLRHVSRTLKTLAGDANCTVLALSQVTFEPNSRDSRAYGSRGLSQDADLEVEIEKQGSTQYERRRNPSGRVVVRKNRQPSGWIGHAEVQMRAWRFWEATRGARSDG
jgi:replicative DNA helicase